jgi:glycosyltransferase involved in cell wall biosynthesis
MDAPRFTIVIPTVNRLGCLARALASALAQTVPVRILVSDNGSSDGTQAYLEGVHHPHLVKRRNPQTLPVQAHARQFHEAVATEWVVLLSDDDYLEPTFIAGLERALASHPGAVMLYTQARIHLWDVAYDSMAGPDVEEGWRFLQRFLEGGREPCWCAMALRRSDLLEVGPPPPDWVIGDMYFWVRIAARGQVACVREVLCHYTQVLAGAPSCTSRADLRTWAREATLLGEAMVERIRAGGDAPREAQLRRSASLYVARTSANQIFWNLLGGRPRGAILADIWHDRALFLAVPRVWIRVLGGAFGTRGLVRWAVRLMVARAYRTRGQAVPHES